MLRKVRPAPRSQAAAGRIAIVASKYNARYVDSMVRAAERVLRAAGAPEPEIVKVPGAHEIPVIAAALARRGRLPLAAIICLGVILRGETAHADLIASAISHALMDIQVNTGLPVIHEVLLLDNEKQATVRCLGAKHNRGAEAAATALEMAAIMSRLNKRSAGAKK